MSEKPKSGEQPQTAAFEAQEHAAAAEGQFGKMEPGAGKPTQRVESAPGVPGPAQPDVRESDEPPENRESTAPEGPLSTDDLTQRKGKDAGDYPEEVTGASHYPGEELKKPATRTTQHPLKEEKSNG